MDVAVPAELLGEIRAVALRVAGVHGLDKCRVRRSGLSLLVDIQIKEVDAGLTVRRGHEIAHDVKNALLGAPFVPSAMCPCTSSRRRVKKWQFFGLKTAV